MEEKYNVDFEIFLLLCDKSNPRKNISSTKALKSMSKDGKSVAMRKSFSKGFHVNVSEKNTMTKAGHKKSSITMPLKTISGKVGNVVKPFFTSAMRLSKSFLNINKNPLHPLLF